MSAPTQEIFGTFMLCFTVWECAVTPVGGCGKNVCLAKLGSGKWYEGSWMSSDWKKQLLQEMVIVFCCQSQESQRICDGFEDYIDIDIVIVLLGANLLEVFTNHVSHLLCWVNFSYCPQGLALQFLWMCSFCYQPLGSIREGSRRPGTWGDFSLRVWKFAGSFQKMIMKPIWYL